MTYYLIDPPVSLYSSKEEIEAWIAELENMEQTAEVRQAVAEAERWIRMQEENGRDA